ncbi:MAG TPA: DNA-processing protein DprA [Smithella sp.]|nr:DNA-processing protein DprA [Smithella sp.]HOG89005.1 DNA-processing protein DprA [Smithella sp.]
MNVQTIRQTDKDYPAVLQNRLGVATPAQLYAMGNVAVLQRRLLGLICSIKCPGSIILKTFDTIRSLRDDGVTMIGGFLSPMERDCLDILLRGKQSIVLCPAKRLTGLRLGNEVRKAINENRLLVLSPFADDIRHTTAAQAIRRNNLVAALADALLVPYAAPEGKTWTTVHTALKRNQPVYTFDVEDNASLIECGAIPFNDILIRNFIHSEELS